MMLYSFAGWFKEGSQIWLDLGPVKIVTRDER